MRLVSLILFVCLCVAAPVEAKPGDRIKALIGKVLHREPTPAAGVSTDKPECQSCKEHSLLRRRTSAAGTQSPSGPAASPHDKVPTAPAEVEPAPKTATSDKQTVIEKPCQCCSLCTGKKGCPCKCSGCKCNK